MSSLFTFLIQHFVNLTLLSLNTVSTKELFMFSQHKLSNNWFLAHKVYFLQSKYQTEKNPPPPNELVSGEVVCVSYQPSKNILSYKCSKRVPVEMCLRSNCFSLSTRQRLKQSLKLHTAWSFDLFSQRSGSKQSELFVTLARSFGCLDPSQRHTIGTNDCCLATLLWFLFLPGWGPTLNSLMLRCGLSSTHALFHSQNMWNKKLQTFHLLHFTSQQVCSTRFLNSCPTLSGASQLCYAFRLPQAGKIDLSLEIFAKFCWNEI